MAEVQALHDARTAARAAGQDVGGEGGQERGVGDDRPWRFDISSEECGQKIGLCSTLLTLAAWRAQEVARNRTARAPHPSCTATLPPPPPVAAATSLPPLHHAAPLPPPAAPAADAP